MSQIWIYLLVGTELVLASWVTVHAVLNKRDTPTAVGWTALAWFAPVMGPALYWMFGINRISRKAHRLRPETSMDGAELELDAGPDANLLLRHGFSEVARLGRVGDRLIRAPLEGGNRVDPLINGDQGYPEMLRAIRGATQSVGLASYIFDNDAVGVLFLEALADASERGVEVRVLIDGIGQNYSSPTMTEVLRRRGIPVQVFLATTLPIRSKYLNLRNHRKILVVDGRLGFTGGLNIRESCWIGRNPPHPTQDLHFRLEGPVVSALSAAFAFDWQFTCGERLQGDPWFPVLSPVGPSLARGIADGPDEDFETIRRMILGALSEAKHRVRIISPYFLPDPTLITALNVTALRDVSVEIVMPEVNNLRFVQWAAEALAEQVLAAGCRVWLSSPPFDHSKLMLVDDSWCLFGSANWDQRSLRLNFELNVECYDRSLISRLHALVDEKVATGRELKLDQLRGRTLPIKVRNNFARLFSPYL